MSGGGKMLPNHNLSKQSLHQQQLEVPARLFLPIKKNAEEIMYL